MPPLPHSLKEKKGVYLGVDPGENGGYAIITPDTVIASKNPATETDLFLELRRVGGSLVRPYVSVFCVIEEQRPRPTSFFDKATKQWRQSILKSTCMLYADYRVWCALMGPAQIPFEAVTPQKWQASFGLKKKKGESPTDWKNRLKAKAQQLFPTQKVTLATADALLIAEYCRRTHGG